MKHLETGLLIAEGDRVLCHLVMVFYCLFPLDIQNETRLLPRRFCYSWLGLFIVVFLVQKCAACQKTDFGKHRFQK